MRTPNSECIICKKPLYRRPFELKKARYVVCFEHREQAKKMFPITEKQKEALSKGRERKTNNLDGIPKSKKWKKSMSQSMTNWCKENPEKLKERGQKTREENHYNWKGGVAILNQSIRRMTENIKWQRAVKKRDGHCMICNSTKELETHHIIPLVVLLDTFNIKNKNEARVCYNLWDLSNGITVCQECHCKIHNRKYTLKGNGRRNKNDNC